MMTSMTTHRSMDVLNQLHNAYIHNET